MKKKTVSFILAVTISITGTITSNAATKPKCTGKTLASFKKNQGLYNRAWADYQTYWADDAYETFQGTRDQLSQLRRLSNQIWLSYGYSYAKYAALCKVKMPQEWQDMLDSLPDN